MAPDETVTAVSGSIDEFCFGGDALASGGEGDALAVGGAALASGSELGVADEFLSGSAGDETLLEPATKRFGISEFKDQKMFSINH